MNRQPIPNLLLIAGTGRNSGKTTFACHVIRRHCLSHSIIAIKISSHFHANVESGNILVNRPNLYLAEETNPETNKDSSLMLNAGARRAFFIMAKDEQLLEAFQYVKYLISKDDFIICESGGLSQFIKPGVFLVFHSTKNIQPKSNTQNLKTICDRFINFEGEKIDFEIADLLITPDGWKINSNT
jgi:hypothetical protein